MAGNLEKIAEEYLAKHGERMEEHRVAERRKIKQTPIVERRDPKSERRDKISQIKRLKGEIQKGEAVKSGSAGRDTLQRDIPKIKERITGLQRELISSAKTSSGKLSGLAGVSSKLGGKALGVVGQVMNVSEHYGAVKEVSKDINKPAPFSDKLGAYVERVLGAPRGTTKRKALPSEREI